MRMIFSSTLALLIGTTPALAFPTEEVPTSEAAYIAKVKTGAPEQIVAKAGDVVHPPSKNTILLAPVPQRMSALTRQKSTLFQWLAVPLWFPTGKDRVPTHSGHSVRVLLDPAARLELGARWVNS